MIGSVTSIKKWIWSKVFWIQHTLTGLIIKNSPVSSFSYLLSCLTLNIQDCVLGFHCSYWNSSTFIVLCVFIIMQNFQPKIAGMFYLTKIRFIQVKILPVRNLEWNVAEQAHVTHVRFFILCLERLVTYRCYVDRILFNLIQYSAKQVYKSYM